MDQASSFFPVKRKDRYRFTADLLRCRRDHCLREDLQDVEQLAQLALLGDLGVGPYLSVRTFGTGGQPRIVARLWGRNTDVAVAVLVCILALMAVPLVRRRRARRRTDRVAEGLAQRPTRAWLRVDLIRKT